MGLNCSLLFLGDHLLVLSDDLINRRFMIFLSLQHISYLLIFCVQIIHKLLVLNRLLIIEMSQLFLAIASLSYFFVFLLFFLLSDVLNFDSTL
jgi:hypothetical protein